MVVTSNCLDLAQYNEPEMQVCHVKHVKLVQKKYEDSSKKSEKGVFCETSLLCQKQLLYLYLYLSEKCGFSETRLLCQKQLLCICIFFQNVFANFCILYKNCKLWTEFAAVSEAATVYLCIFSNCI